MSGSSFILCLGYLFLRFEALVPIGYSCNVFYMGGHGPGLDRNHTSPCPSPFIFKEFKSGPFYY